MVSFWDCLLKVCVFFLVFPKRNIVHNIIIVLYGAIEQEREIKIMKERKDKIYERQE